MDHAVINSFIVACVTMVVGALAFFAKQWIDGLGRSITELSANVHEMTYTLHDMKNEMVNQRVSIKRHAAVIQQLQMYSCTRPDCPSKEKMPGHMFTQLADAVGGVDDL